jgi:hypothetical protein
MMEKAISWLRSNSNIRDDVRRSFQADARLKNDALPDALATNPILLSDMAKELVCLAVRQDAPEGVVEELMSAVRIIKNGAAELVKSIYLTKVLRELRGLRDAYELEPVLKKALAEATGDVDKSKLQNMIEVVQRSAGSFGDPETLPPDSTDLSPHCVPCCFIGCTVCTVDCLVCCAIGCAVCS